VSLRGADPATEGHLITLSPFRRPRRSKHAGRRQGGCLYPNNARADCSRRNRRGFDNCLVCDMLGNVAELGTANVFYAKDGVVHTPAVNGTFLDGITRQRHHQAPARRECAGGRGHAALQGTFENADEIFLLRELHQG